MKFSREFYFRAYYFHFFFHFFHFRARLIFAQRKKKVWFYQTKTIRMLVFCWYLVEKKTQNMSFKNRAILFSRTFSIRADYIFAQEHCAKIKLTRKFHELRYTEMVNFRPRGNGHVTH